MSEVVREVLSGAFHSGNTGAIVEASQLLGDGIVKILSDEKIIHQGCSGRFRRVDRARASKRILPEIELLVAFRYTF